MAYRRDTPPMAVAPNFRPTMATEEIGHIWDGNKFATRICPRGGRARSHDGEGLPTIDEPAAFLVARAFGGTEDKLVFAGCRRRIMRIHRSL